MKVDQNTICTNINTSSSHSPYQLFIVEGVIVASLVAMIIMIISLIIVAPAVIIHLALPAAASSVPSLRFPIPAPWSHITWAFIATLRSFVLLTLFGRLFTCSPPPLSPPPCRLCPPCRPCPPCWFPPWPWPWPCPCPPNPPKSSPNSSPPLENWIFSNWQERIGFFIVTTQRQHTGCGKY